MHKTDTYKSGFSLILLFCFLFGALMTILYLRPVKAAFSESELTPLFIMAVLFAVSCLTASSLNGIVVLPGISALFGCAAAMELDFVRTELASGADMLLPRISVLIVLIPLHFVVCGWGMGSSAVIRAAMRGQEQLYGKTSLLSYTIMFTGIIAAALLIRYIMLI